MTDVLLSICIPTHQGRASTLAQALDSVLLQLAPDLAPLVEICVSDNASSDGTEELIRRLQNRHPGVITYRRHTGDLGGPQNLLSSVEVAGGRWCWLLSSDDALESGALAGALSLIGRERQASGFTVGWKSYDRLLGAALAPDVSRPPWNAGGRERALRSAPEIFTECGPLFDYMSIHIFKRGLWQQAAAALGPTPLAETWFPTTYVLGHVCQRDPFWVWSALPAIKARAHNLAMMSSGPTDPTRLRQRAFDHQRRVWASLLGDEQELQRHVAGRWVDVYAYHDALVADRHHPDTRLSGQLHLLWSLARATYRSPTFWRGTLPALVVPAPLTRAWPRAQSRLCPYSRLAPSDCATRIRTTLAEPQDPRSTRRISCVVANMGSRVLRSAMPNPVHLSYRWFDSESGELVLEGDRARLEPPLRPGHSRSYELDLTMPSASGMYVLRVSLLQELVAWFDDLAADNGWTQRVTVRPDQMVDPGTSLSPASAADDAAIRARKSD